MAANFHISSRGTPARCPAKKRCRLGGPHGTKAEIIATIEKQAAEQYAAQMTPEIAPPRQLTPEQLRLQNARAGVDYNPDYANERYHIWRAAGASHEAAMESALEEAVYAVDQEKAAFAAASTATEGSRFAPQPAGLIPDVTHLREMYDRHYPMADDLPSFMPAGEDPVLWSTYVSIRKREERNQAGVEAAIRNFSIGNDLSDPQVRPLANKLRTDAVHSGPGSMYRGITGYGGVSGVGWNELRAGVSLEMKPRSWTNSERVADDFTWDQSADEDDDSIKSVLIVSENGIDGVRIDRDSEFDWQNETVSTSGRFVVDRVEARDGAGSVADSESIAIFGRWETTRLNDADWEASLKPYEQQSR